MKASHTSAVAVLFVAAQALSTASCKKQNATEWQESDLQSMAPAMAVDTEPPDHILARVLMAERELVLKIINFWASSVNKSEQKNKQSVLNQIRRMFDPDHMKKLTVEEAMNNVRKDGSGIHGSMKNLRTTQDSLYHAMWSRISDAAALTGFPRSSKHMKHYLSNSGQPLRYSPEETTALLNQAKKKGLRTDSQSDADFFAYELQRRLSTRGIEISRSEAAMIAGMTSAEMAYYLARLNVVSSLSALVKKEKISSPSVLINRVAAIRKKNFPAKTQSDSGVWTNYRPIGKYYGTESSEPHSDLYFSMGSFTSVFSATPIDVQNEGQSIKIRFAQSTAVFDKYNWDDGKFVTLFSGWCWKLNSANCEQIESLTSLTVSDKSIGRLHRLGLAREFQIHGQTRVSTVWDAVQFEDLQSAQKEKARDALEILLSEYLSPLEFMAD
ncbi:MAG: hypothetical protein EBR09_04460 [Proteobacteria bacterium]|nr:hypothetical protein [Pseudomonadota bacterium]